ncbi:transcriptional regulator [Bdellovibrio sp. ZAP7]|uniref:ArsR/SmtB family transcription factor n=1 Tax=Bdellovibrio sp. ZAP7 TaxID=2231053 RepID=UPI001157A03D|nr:metalloregulator ArsR/SmtB family transcription factor [Bdellovibrio sp. ZAP7]QDK47072.1 transcriptional regulator [Bdellovibrio sp. ZAP7]
MVNILSSDLDNLFYALSDPTRRQILKMLNEGTHTIGELSDPFKMSLQAISKHIKILESAKLLNRKKSGRIHECTINPEALKIAEECIQFYTQFWNNQLDAFAANLESKNKSSKRSK